MELASRLATTISFLELLLFILPAILVGASDPHFVDLSANTTTPNFRFATGTNLRASSSAHRNLAKAAEWRQWPSSYINNIEIIHNLCDDAWITAVERAAKAWSDMSASVGLKVTAARCNSKVNGDLSYIPFKIHLVYGTCGGNCCGKADVEYSWRGGGGDFDITEYQALVRLDPDCFEGNWPEGKQYLACHEIGHAIGLGHNNDRDSCLASWNGNNYGPGRDDIRVLDNELYPDSKVQGGTNPGMSAVNPTIDDNIFSGSDTLTEVSNRDCRAGQCGTCQGDCDADSQCQPGLRCFFRSDSRSIPGCKGLGIYAKDYCYDPSASVSQARPTPRPPTPRPPTPRPPTPPSSPQIKTLRRVANKRCNKGQCSKCQGDCDRDSDCQRGLKCFFRKSKNPWEPVPGCRGDGQKGRDYCYDPNDFYIYQTGRGGSF